MAKLKLALLIPDTHRPYHHIKAYNLMIKVSQELDPDYIYLLGDYADFYSIHQHGAKDPRLPGLLKTEVDEINNGLDQLDTLFPRARKVFIQGNHEYRLERYIQSKAPELFGITDCQHLFNLPKRPGWSWVPYGPNQRTKVLDSKLWARHEPLGNNAKLTASRALASIVYGHIHRIESSHIVGLDGTNHIAYSVGWLGDKRKDEVFGYVKGHHQWQMGFGLVFVNPSNGYFYPVQVHILDNITCMVNGKLFSNEKGSNLWGKLQDKIR